VADDDDIVFDNEADEDAENLEDDDAFIVSSNAPRGAKLKRKKRRLVKLSEREGGDD
jgi:hypothetical protein